MHPLRPGEEKTTMSPPRLFCKNAAKSCENIRKTHSEEAFYKIIDQGSSKVFQVTKDKSKMGTDGKTQRGTVKDGIEKPGAGKTLVAKLGKTVIRSAN